MHGGAQGQHDLADILGDAGILRRFHVGGNGGNRGAGAQGGDGGAGNAAEHLTHGALAAAEPGEQGEGGEDVDKAQRVINGQGPGIVRGDLRAVSSHQVGKEAEEGDGSIVGDQLHDLHHGLSKAGEQGGDGAVRTGAQVDAEAHQDGKDDQRQHGTAAEQGGKVADSEEVDDQIRNGNGIVHHALGQVAPGLQYRRDQLHQHDHDGGGDGAGDDEGQNGGAHDFTGTPAAAHGGNGSGDGRKHHGDHDAEHHVDEQGAQGLEDGGTGLDDLVTLLDLGEDGAHDGAQDHGTQHDGQERVVVGDRLFGQFLAHILSPPKMVWGICMARGPYIPGMGGRSSSVISPLQTMLVGPVRYKLAI